ncbi:cytochrome P450, putative [Ixodes scapularis]|uniref:Cytochrome P450, putative n=2 Tax=Ixodes scapularis TaxID=6945 RepID=B7P9Q4_IXOSC|nr:cytochrome P450, putative [Ixodes scapularis]|eukprot:XP_002405125.1 cytochrome P450, putative [Ixodes scapularis]
MNAMTVVVVAFLALVGFFVWKLQQIFTFWSDKGVPYLTLWQYLRVVYDMYTKPLHEVIRKNYERYGRLYGSYQGIVPTLVVGDPDILADVFVKNFKSFSDRTEAQTIGTDIWKKSILNLSGEEWKHARGILSPAFTANQLRKAVVKIHKISERMTTRLAEYAKDKKPVAINE